MSEFNDLLAELKESLSTNDPTFPLDFYPPDERDLMLQLRDAKGVSLQHMGLGMLPVFARIYNKYRANAFNGAFKVYPIFWGAIIDQPGSTKSEALKVWYNPLNKLNNFDQSEGSTPYYYTATDTTPEGLIANMKDQDEGLYLFYDEITSFIGGIGQYKKDSSSDKGFWLSMFSGGDITQFRVNGGIRHMKEQSISVFGSSQPETIKKVFKAGDLTNGFFDRFLWSVETNGLPKLQRNPDYNIDNKVKIVVDDHITTPKFDSNVIKYATKARNYLFDWYDAKANEFEHSAIKRQFFGKDIIYINRFAMLTSLIYNKGETFDISLECAERAVALYDFCDAMRWRAFELVNEENETSENMSKSIAGRWLIADDPDINRSKLAKIIGVSRRALYEK